MECPGCDGYATFVDDRIAGRDVERYRANGPDRTTRMLLDMIEARAVPGATLLDVGGGIGVIDQVLLRDGVASRAVLVEASPDYVHAARRLADEAGVLDRLEIKAFDFARHAEEVAVADVVTLDRVVCCYRDADALVGASVAHARRLIGIVLPQDRWFARLAIRFENVLWRLRGRAFRAYAHPHSGIDRLIEAGGFSRLGESQAGIWRVALFGRVSTEA